MLVSYEYVYNFANDNAGTENAVKYNGGCQYVCINAISSFLYFSSWMSHVDKRSIFKILTKIIVTLDLQTSN